MAQYQTSAYQTSSSPPKKLVQTPAPKPVYQTPAPPPSPAPNFDYLQNIPRNSSQMIQQRPAEKKEETLPRPVPVTNARGTAAFNSTALEEMRRIGTTDNVIADEMAKSSTLFASQLRKIRTKYANDPAATSALLNTRFYGDANYNPIQETKTQGTIGRTLDRIYGNTRKGMEELGEQYSSGQITSGQVGMRFAPVVSGAMLEPVRALTEPIAQYVMDRPFVKNAIQDIAQSELGQGIGSEFKDIKAAYDALPESSGWRDLAAGGKVGLDVLEAMGAQSVWKSLGGSVVDKAALSPAQFIKDTGRGTMGAITHPWETASNMRGKFSAPFAATQAGAIGGATGGAAMGATTGTRRLTGSAEEAVKKGMDEKVMTFVAEQNADTRAVMGKMTVAANEGTTKLGGTVAHKEILGGQMLENTAYVLDEKKVVGQALGAVKKAVANESVELTYDYIKVMKSLRDKGAVFDDQGRIISLAGAADDNIPLLQKTLDFLKPDNTGRVYKTGKEIDLWRTKMFQEMNSAKLKLQPSTQGQSVFDFAENVTNEVRASSFSRMAKGNQNMIALNNAYEELSTEASKFLKSIGYKGKLDIDSITSKDLRTGEIALRALGNASANTREAFMDLISTARRYGRISNIDEMALIKYADALEDIFPISPTRSLRGEMTRSTRDALGNLTEDIIQSGAKSGVTRAVADAVIGRINTMRGITPENRFKLLMEVLDAPPDTNFFTIVDDVLPDGAIGNLSAAEKRAMGRMDAEDVAVSARKALSDLASPEGQAQLRPKRVLASQAQNQGISEALPSTLPDSPPPVNSPKANPPMARGAAAKNVMSSVKGNSLIKDKKLILREKKYPIQEVNQFLDDNFNVSKYASLQGKDNVYIVAPSTSGKNTIPLQMAQRLQAQYGGQVMDNAILGIGRTEAKGKNFLEKALSKSDFELAVDTSALQGKNIVLVDDIFTSGGTVKGINDVLATKGVPVNDIAVLSAGDVRFASQKDLARIAKKLSENVGIDEVEAKSLVDNLEGISKTGANQIELNLNRNPQKIYDRLREASTSARRTQRPPSGGATVKGAGDTKGDNVGVGKMEKRERQAFGAGEDALPKALPREGGEAAGKTMNKTPINRPIEAEAARIKMEDAFKEINDQVAKTGTVNAKKWREANDLAKEYWKTRDALDAKGTAALQNPPLSAKIGDMTKTKLPPHLQNLVDKFDGATRIDDVTPEGFGPMKTAKEPTLIDKLPNEDWAQAKMRLLQNQIDNGTVSLKQIPESSGGHGWEAKILAGEQVRSFRGFKKQDVIDDIFDELYPNAKFVKDSPLPKADLLAEARKAKNVREFTESQLKKKYGLRNEEDITITARRQYDTSTRLEKSVRKIENKIKEQVENEFNFEYLKKNPEKLTEEIRDAANSRLKELEDKSAELSNAKKAAMEFYSSRIDTNEAYKELDRLTSLWKEANQSQ